MSPVKLSGLPPISTAFESRAGSGIGGSITAEKSAGVRLGREANRTSSVNDSFGAYLEAKLQETNKLQHAADETVAAVATGRSNNLHEMMIALDRADISFRMVTQIRNKAIDAYQEIMRMPI
jgi:flagellar hook-basal body complex protein FliE